MLTGVGHPVSSLTRIDAIALRDPSSPAAPPCRTTPRPVLGLSLAILAGWAMGCAAPPVKWGGDFDRALRALRPGELLVVQFLVQGQPESEAQIAEVDIADAVSHAMVGARGVRLDAEAEAARFRSVFDLGPLLATCIFDAEGRVLTAETGYVGAGSLCALVRQARDGQSRVAEAAARLAAVSDASGPARAAASLELADAYDRTGNRNEARRLWKVVAMLPAPTAAARGRVVTACNQLALLALARGDALDARDWLELLRETSPAAVEEPDVQLTFALQARLEGRTEAAEVMLRRLRRGKGKTAPRVLFELAGVCHDRGRDEEAREILEDLISRFADSKWRPRAEAELQHLASHVEDADAGRGR